jgi:hypothetical protein
LKPYLVGCLITFSAVIFKSDMAEGRANTKPLMSGLNPYAPSFDMDGLIAAGANT